MYSVIHFTWQTHRAQVIAFHLEPLDSLFYEYARCLRRRLCDNVPGTFAQSLQSVFHIKKIIYGIQAYSGSKIFCCKIEPRFWKCRHSGSAPGMPVRYTVRPSSAPLLPYLRCFRRRVKVCSKRRGYFDPVKFIALISNGFLCIVVTSKALRHDQEFVADKCKHFVTWK